MRNIFKEKFVLLFLILVVIVILVGSIYTTFFLNRRNIAVNDQANNIADVKIDGLNFINASLKYEKGLSIFKVTVINTTNDIIELNLVDFVFRNIQNKEIATLTGYVGEKLSPGDEKNISSSIDQDIRTAKDIKYLLKKK